MPDVYNTIKTHVIAALNHDSPMPTTHEYHQHHADNITQLNQYYLDLQRSQDDLLTNRYVTYYLIGQLLGDITLSNAYQLGINHRRDYYIARRLYALFRPEPESILRCRCPINYFNQISNAEFNQLMNDVSLFRVIPEPLPLYDLNAPPSYSDQQVPDAADPDLISDYLDLDPEDPNLNSPDDQSSDSDISSHPSEYISDADDYYRYIYGVSPPYTDQHITVPDDQSTNDITPDNAWIDNQPNNDLWMTDDPGDQEPIATSPATITEEEPLFYPDTQPWIYHIDIPDSPYQHHYQILGDNYQYLGMY